MSEEGWEQKYVKEAFDTNWVVPMGPNVNAFEKDLEAFANSKTDGSEPLDRKVVCLSAGTAAVHLALIGCGIGPGDEVCVQSYTFCASSHPITYLGATPVFVDSEPTTWNMDPELLEKAIIDRKPVTGKYPKAIVPVALYGMPYQIDKIMAIADKYGIPVVEDAAEGMGSRFNGQVLGTFGQFGVLSFNGNKMITTSGSAAGVIKAVDSATTDCQPNEKVEALRMFMLSKKVECRPVWKPMHKQPVYKNAPAYVNGVSESIFKVGFCLPAGPYVTDDDVRYIVDCIKEAIV